MLWSLIFDMLCYGCYGVYYALAIVMLWCLFVMVSLVFVMTWHGYGMRSDSKMMCITFMPHHYKGVFGEGVEDCSLGLSKIQYYDATHSPNYPR